MKHSYDCHFTRGIHICTLTGWSAANSHMTKMVLSKFKDKICSFWRGCFTSLFSTDYFEHENKTFFLLCVCKCQHVSFTDFCKLKEFIFEKLVVWYFWMIEHIDTLLQLITWWEYCKELTTVLQNNVNFSLWTLLHNPKATH